MEYLSLYRCDGRERQRKALAAAGLLDDGGHFGLVDAWTNGPIGSKMHARGHVNSLVDDGNLLLILIDSLADDGLHHAFRHLNGLLLGVQSEQFPQPYLVVATVGRQEVDVLSTATCLVEIGFQLVHGARVADSTCCGALVECRNRARPYDVVNGQLIAKDYFTILIDVDDGCQSGIVETEEVEERRVLTEAIGVVSIVHAHFMVAQEEQQATAHVLLQACAAAQIRLFFDLHRGYILV